MLSLGINMATGVVGLGIGGHWLDGRYGTGRTWTLVGLFLGLLFGFYETWKMVRQIKWEADASDKRVAGGSHGG